MTEVLQVSHSKCHFDLGSSNAEQTKRVFRVGREYSGWAASIPGGPLSFFLSSVPGSQRGSLGTEANITDIGDYHACT